MSNLAPYWLKFRRLDFRGEVRAAAAAVRKLLVFFLLRLPWRHALPSALSALDAPKSGFHSDSAEDSAFQEGDRKRSKEIRAQPGPVQVLETARGLPRTQMPTRAKFPPCRRPEVRKKSFIPNL